MRTAVKATGSGRLRFDGRKHNHHRIIGCAGASAPGPVREDKHRPALRVIAGERLRCGRGLKCRDRYPTVRPKEISVRTSQKFQLKRVAGRTLWSIRPRLFSLVLEAEERYARRARGLDVRVGPTEACA